MVGFAIPYPINLMGTRIILGAAFQSLKIQESPENNSLRLGAWVERSVVNGPGERFVLWVQGCPLHCCGCINPEFWPFDGGKEVTVADLASRIIATPGIEGVTYTGGEPTKQAKPLAVLSRILKLHGLTILSYSGYTLTDLQITSDPAVQELLGELDILIDGPYAQDQAAALPWRGSRNQQVHFLSPVYRHLAEASMQPERHIELISDSDQWILTGTWDDDLKRLLETRLKVLLNNGKEERSDSEC